MDLLDRLLGHDTWTTQQLLECSRSLDEAGLDLDHGFGPGSVRNTLRHMIRNMEVWSRLMAGRAFEREASEAPSLEELEGRLLQAGADLAELSRAVRGRNGWDELWVDATDGKERSFGGAIAHVITHSMHHRAQLIVMLHRLGLDELPEGDVLSWEARDRAD